MPLEAQFRRNTAVALIACFFLLLWLPTLDLVFHFDHAPTPNENRAPAAFPTLVPTLQSLRDFPAGMDGFFRDHFGFRNRLIRLERHWKKQLFRETTAHEVITGRAGWLFTSGDNVLDDFQGLRPFSEDTLRRWQTLLEGRRDWLAQRGIKYLFVIAPDKQTIYPEFLPDWLARRGASNRLDQFMAYFRAHSTVPILDLRPVLEEGKQTGPVYLQTDTHWNSRGGLLTYQRLVQALARQLPDLGSPLSSSDFELRPTQTEPGDLARVLGLAGTLVESNGLTCVPRPALGRPASRLAPERLARKWRPGADPVVTDFPAPVPKAILFRDSFANSWIGLLGYHFREVIYIWQYEWDPAFLEREKPTVVVDEMLERFLNNDESLQKMERVRLP